MQLPLDILIALAVGFFVIGLGVGSLPAYSFSKRVRFMDHVIDIRNHPLGWETIIIDGKVVLKKWTFQGTHKFLIGQERPLSRLATDGICSELGFGFS
jgi:hypothetical protein